MHLKCISLDIKKLKNVFQVFFSMIILFDFEYSRYPGSSLIIFVGMITVVDRWFLLQEKYRTVSKQNKNERYHQPISTSSAHQLPALLIILEILEMHMSFRMR